MPQKRKRSGKGGKTKTESRHNYIIEVDVQRVKLPKKSGVQIELKAPAFWKWIKSLPASDCYNESGEFIPATPNARTAYFLKRPDSNLPVKTVTRQLPQDLKGLAKWEVDADYLIRNGYPVFGFMLRLTGQNLLCRHRQPMRLLNAFGIVLNLSCVKFILIILLIHPTI